jgi:hypothetical protein
LNRSPRLSFWNSALSLLLVGGELLFCFLRKRPLDLAVRLKAVERRGVGFRPPLLRRMFGPIWAEYSMKASVSTTESNSNSSS